MAENRFDLDMKCPARYFISALGTVGLWLVNNANASLDIFTK